MRVVPRRRRSGAVVAAPLLVVALAVLGLGCGGGSSNAPTSSTAVGLKAAPGSAERAVLDFWRYFQVSSWPALAAAYDDEVVDTLGSGDLMSAIALAGGALQKAAVRKVDAVPTPVGTLVSLTLRNQGQDEMVSFLVRRDGTGWRIIYDSLLAGILPTFVHTEVAAQTGETEGRPSQGTINAGNEAVRIYRQIFAPSPRVGRIMERVEDELDRPLGTASETGQP